MAEGSAITKGSSVFILSMKWTGELLVLKTPRLVLNIHGVTPDPQKFRINHERLAFSTTYKGLHGSIKHYKEVVK